MSWTVELLVIVGTLVTEFIPQSILYFLIAVLLLIAVALVFYRRTIANRMHDEIHKTVIAFAKTGEGRDLMMEAPADISDEQLEELKIVLKKEEE